MTEREIQVCPGCGYPSYAGHASSCPMVSGRESVEEAVSEADRKIFFELFYRVHGVTDDISRRVQSELKYFDRMPQSIFGGGERRVFVIRDQNQNVIAGAELVMGEKEDKKEAYLGHKVVDERHRGRNLGSVLQKEMLQRAIEKGCSEAWALVAQDNIAALRSINKDGFLIKGNGFIKTGNEVSRDTYYVSRDLTREPPTLLTIESIEHTKHAETAEQLESETVLVALDDKEFIQQAFEHGYIGRQVVLPKDSQVIRQPMILMEKIPSTEREKREKSK